QRRALPFGPVSFFAPAGGGQLRGPLGVVGGAQDAEQEVDGVVHADAAEGAEAEAADRRDAEMEPRGDWPVSLAREHQGYHSGLLSGQAEAEDDGVPGGGRS